MPHLEGTEQLAYTNWLLFHESINSDRMKVIEAHIKSCDNCAIETFDMVKRHEIFLDKKATESFVADIIAEAKIEMEMNSNVTCKW